VTRHLRFLVQAVAEGLAFTVLCSALGVLILRLAS
jgi:hypothetical protein